MALYRKVTELLKDIQKERNSMQKASNYTKLAPSGCIFAYHFIVNILKGIATLSKIVLSPLLTGSILTERIRP